MQVVVSDEVSEHGAENVPPMEEELSPCRTGGNGPTCPTELIQTAGGQVDLE